MSYVSYSKDRIFLHGGIARSRGPRGTRCSATRWVHATPRRTPGPTPPGATRPGYTATRNAQAMLTVFTGPRGRRVVCELLVPEPPPPNLLLAHLAEERLLLVIVQLGQDGRVHPHVLEDLLQHPGDRNERRRGLDTYQKTLPQPPRQ